MESLLICQGCLTTKVSIPYEREGAWKDKRTFTERTRSRDGFNSLRTGRGMERRTAQRASTRLSCWFQFPTNGKGHGKYGPGILQSDERSSFNSLRTGRGMESGRTPASKPSRFWTRVSIPYEREGAWKEFNQAMTTKVANVSIPYEREGAWKETYRPF